MDKSLKQSAKLGKALLKREDKIRTLTGYCETCGAAVKRKRG
jgi:hypothetical protein